MKPLVIVQARMGSRRLPGKVLATIGGITVLERVINQLCICGQLGQIVIATGTELADNPIIQEAERLDIRAYRGHPTDLLTRYTDCHHAFGGNPIVRITADSPFLNPQLLDRTVAVLLDNGYDYVGVKNAPAGVAQEAFTAEILHAANRWARSPEDREHVVPWMIRNGNCGWITYTGPQEPLALDTPEDLERLRAMVAA